MFEQLVAVSCHYAVGYVTDITDSTCWISVSKQRSLFPGYVMKD